MAEWPAFFLGSVAGVCWGTSGAGTAPGLWDGGGTRRTGTAPLPDRGGSLSTARRGGERRAGAWSGHRGMTKREKSEPRQGSRNYLAGGRSGAGRLAPHVLKDRREPRYLLSGEVDL